MKNKKNIFIIAILIFIAAGGFLFIGKLYTMNFDKTSLAYISKKTGLNLADGNVIMSSENNGFHGDGISYSVIELDKNFENDNSLKLQELNALPMTEDLNILMYGGSKGASVFSYEYLKKADIPQIQNGYYKFVNFNDKSENLLYENIKDFYIFIYDKDNYILYFYEYHS